MNWNVETLMKKSPQPANACRNLEIKHLVNMKDVEQNEWKWLILQKDTR